MSHLTNFETLDAEIKKLPGKPVVLEALWDGDFEGWYLCLYVYIESPDKQTSRHMLGHIMLGNDARLFFGGDWTEIAVAKDLGQKAIEKYNLTFYFPADDRPDDDAPAWNERHLAINCADCNKLIIPTTSPYLPKDICYHCHLEREANERISSEKPHDDGILMYLFKDGVYSQLGYCSNFESYAIAPYIDHKIPKSFPENTITVITLEQTDIRELIEKMEYALQPLLEKYEKPKRYKNRPLRTYKLEYKGVQYELEQRLNDDHDQIAELIRSIATAQEALAEGAVYKIYFKSGITYCDDSVLRFIKYVQQGATGINDIIGHYKKILSEELVMQTLQKLQAMDCLAVEGSEVRILEKGERIV